jgi:hypothetical protein
MYKFILNFLAGLPDAICNDTSLVCEKKRLEVHTHTHTPTHTHTHTYASHTHTHTHTHTTTHTHSFRTVYLLYRSAREYVCTYRRMYPHIRTYTRNTHRHTHTHTHTHTHIRVTHTQLLECLLAHGALVQARDIFGDTPLHYAAVRGYPRLTKKWA